MGREVRRVPPNWEHPRYFSEEITPGHNYPRAGDFKPLVDMTFDDAMNEWIEGWRMWQAGSHPDQLNPRLSTDGDEFWNWNGGPPAPDSHRRAFREEPSWYQLYQTVSEGTPVTPPFSTPEELIDHLAQHGESLVNLKYRKYPTREGAEALVRQGIS